MFYSLSIFICISVYLSVRFSVIPFIYIFFFFLNVCSRVQRLVAYSGGCKTFCGDCTGKLEKSIIHSNITTYFHDKS